MYRRICWLVIWVFLLLLISACGRSIDLNEANPHRHYKDDKMIGTVWEIDNDDNSLIIDISEWEKRDRKGAGITDEGYSYMARLSEETRMKYEDGRAASIDDIKKGQKVLVNPPRGNKFEGYPMELVLLEMSHEEKYSRFLSHIDGFNIVVMYENGGTVPVEMQDSLYGNVLDILEGTEHEAVAAWIEYDEDHVIDYKKDLRIEQFPVILVFDPDALLFKTYHADDLYAFFNNLKN
ncbi:hypothetical protein [Planomicrobium soli]|uniref:hypothetical protein n=1 Tax=Planomicrobium soli TaxID=1176648 RepID=UPI0011B1CB7D|nr:hypothetical protein [Planomicrobium soli]